MLRICIHIERLLIVNDCVIIPEFGGFVLQRHPAVYAANTHTFLPPHREIVFNPALTHNDGLLAQSYMQFYHMHFREAQLALKQDIERLKVELQTANHISLGAVGSFRKGTEGSLLFLPGKPRAISGAEVFGLEILCLSPLPADRLPTVEPTTPDKRKIYLPVHRVIWRTAGVAAALTALFLLTSPPARETSSGRTDYAAGLVLPATLPEQTALPAIPCPRQRAEEPVETSVPAPVIGETATQPDDTSLPSKAPVRQKTYYIIIGSFHTEKQAETFMTQTNLASCKETGLVTRNEKVRVYAARFDTREEAEAYLSRLRSDHAFKNAWLFVDR
jgi:hypothetical protein